MRTLPPGLQARLETGCTTLATAWILRRTDGVVLGFTDHDADLVVDGVTCHAASGFDASAAAEKLGFAPSAAEVAGALVDDAIAEADLRAGRYYGATVEVHCVDWERPDLTVHLSTLTLGSVTREGKAFRAELRSRASALDVERGRLYTPRCSADLGDARCGVDLTGPDRRGEAVVVATGEASLVLSGLTLDIDRLAGGRLAVTSGAAAGWSVEIAAASVVSGGVRLSLWQSPPEQPAPGDAVTVTIGCDKSFATCRDRFANALNFRGFPHMPGIDRILSVPVPGEGGHDGSVVG
ncbi:DUF2163 domain-containing protein [Phreatobacter oligotrophus]|uniref:Putative phage protein (TIGR02218 family) n=1 Tax=Phreatobacter oligotrophus TaxID=1122261 RepID=A0A2T4ZFF5_9HYPH|nr:DUF2163 domain-containing protein [Phreatobacter oligotrophus]PTM60650.1 putative phage protein (TIGR02218 family) [Phreatobacter oligotrophus]